MVSEKVESPSSVQEEEREVVRECSNRHFENISTGSGDTHTHLPSRTLALCMLRRCSILYRTILLWALQRLNAKYSVTGSIHIINTCDIVPLSILISLQFMVLHM